MNDFQHINMTNFIKIVFFFNFFDICCHYWSFPVPGVRKLSLAFERKITEIFLLTMENFHFLILQTLPIFLEKLHFFFKFFDIFVVFWDCFFSRTKKPPRVYFVNWMHSFQKYWNVSQLFNFTNFSIFWRLLKFFSFFDVYFYCSGFSEPRGQRTSFRVH